MAPTKSSEVPEGISKLFQNSVFISIKRTLLAPDFLRDRHDASNLAKKAEEDRAKVISRKPICSSN
jgi:hypothetical protein